MSQFTFPQRRAIIKGLLSASNPTKQELGRRFAYFLGFTPGPKGPDDGIDGLIEENGLKIHFQSKLSANKLNVDEAKKYYSDIKYHGVKIKTNSLSIDINNSSSSFCKNFWRKSH